MQRPSTTRLARLAVRAAVRAVGRGCDSSGSGQTPPDGAPRRSAPIPPVRDRATRRPASYHARHPSPHHDPTGERFADRRHVTCPATGGAARRGQFHPSGEQSRDRHHERATRRITVAALPAPPTTAVRRARCPARHERRTFRRAMAMIYRFIGLFLSSCRRRGPSSYGSPSRSRSTTPPLPHYSGLRGPCAAVRCDEQSRNRDTYLRRTPRYYYSLSKTE